MQPFLAMILPVGGGMGGVGGPVDPGWNPPGIGGPGSRPPGVPTHPIAPLPGYPAHPIGPLPGHPEHPIYPGAGPSHPIVIVPPPPGSPPGTPGWPVQLPVFPWTPQHPIELPPEMVPEGPIDWKAAWTPETGWIVVGVPTVPVPTPSK
jgi:hypothetical protein